MVRLSDYLNYLNDEIIQARKLADEHAVEIAKEYAKHEHLRYFRVPRFSTPSIKMEIPIKISELDTKTKYNFKMNEESFIEDVNTKIKEVNLEKNLKLTPITKKTLSTNNFKTIIKTLEDKDYRFVRKIEDSLNQIDFKKPLRSLLNSTDFSTLATVNEKEEMATILRESMKNRYTPVSAKLNNIFIDPDTTKETDKDKILLKLNVEMVEEGIRILRVKDEKGNEIEEIIFE
ncbi:hypothetical protein [Urechidicola croceus]|uniref:Uncharacterized protein n=1 Tax=Urechidicola croceus TaxID=1850246 RepID=A0A1D8P3S2_9FLAO|nr:hypothetical protein [Urechidicola croceus]AOW19181.1 hypothetical protein LPB138_00085 [Urechidicola croceus]